MISLCCHFSWEYDGSGRSGKGGGIAEVSREFMVIMLPYNCISTRKDNGIKTLAISALFYALLNCTRQSLVTCHYIVCGVLMWWKFVSFMVFELSWDYYYFIYCPSVLSLYFD